MVGATGLSRLSAGSASLGFAPALRFRAGSRTSGVILVMQANGLYMLKVPKLVHDEALVPLGREVSRLRDEMAETVSRHTEVTKDTFAVCEKTRQVAEVAAMAAKELDETIRDGWREVNTEKLAARIQGELETAVLRPLVAQCRQVEEMTPALKDAADQLEESARRLRAFHFKGILAVMLAACVVVMGGGFAYGWWNLSRHYDHMVDAALKRILSVNAGNQEAFTRLTRMNVPIRVLPVTDSKKQTIPRKFALVMDHAEDVAVEDTPDGKRVAIYFEKVAY